MLLLNRVFDDVVRPELSIGRHTWPSFQVLGCTGLEFAVLLGMGLVIYMGLSPLVMGLVIFAAILSFYTVAYATKILTNQEQLVYYHHEIGLVLFVLAALWLVNAPPLGYLDAAIMGLGTFLAFGRIGCLMAGCCFGRPHRWGVCYGHRHAHSGFPTHYLGVRLFPIQIVESLWVTLVVVVGVAMILDRQPPGSAFVWYVIAYDIGRFLFEFVRGDADRPYYYGFSEAQWVSLLLSMLIVLCGALSLLPVHLWHVGTILVLLVVMAGTAYRRQKQSATSRLLQPAHVDEIAQAVAGPAKVTTRTSRGVCITPTQLPGSIPHFVLSTPSLSADYLNVLTALLLQLRAYRGVWTLVPGAQAGVFHLILGEVPAPVPGAGTIVQTLAESQHLAAQANDLKHLPIWAQNLTPGKMLEGRIDSETSSGM